MKKLCPPRLLRVSVLFLVFLFVPVLFAADFDFYGSDLIGKESYRKISMDFKDASLKNILKVFSEQAGLNFIAAQGVQERTITLYLDNVPLQEALRKIMSANNLTYELEPGGNVFVVKETGRPELETITKVYRLKFTRLSTSTLQKAITQGESNMGGSVGGSSGDTSGGDGASGGGGGASGGGESSEGIEKSLLGVLSANGKLMQDTRTNSLIITDVASQFEIIDKVIALLDVPTPQVMIEVEMLDVAKKTVDQMGVDTSASLLQLNGATTQTKFPFFADAIASQTPATFTYGTLSSAVFSAVLDLLTTDSKTKFLARPRILTLSNQTAEIKITTNEAIGLKTTQNASQGASTTTQEAERYQTGISLNVTPQVDAVSGTVTMFIQPTVSVAVAGGTFGGTTFKDPEIRSSSTTLMVKDGETIVVGGLIKSTEDLVEQRVPFLGDIPLIGLAFRHKDKTVQDRELIVFITPHIVGFDNAGDIVKKEMMTPGLSLSREQSSPVAKKEVVDHMLERWGH